MRVHGKSYKEHLADVRLNVWLWLELRKGGLFLPAINFDGGNFRDYLITTVGEYRIGALIENVSVHRLLPAERLDWITDDRRQLNWLSFYMQREFMYGIQPVPATLFGRRLILANLDFSDWDLNRKAQFVEGMRISWNEHVRGDRIFSWFQGEEEGARCAFAWEWLIEKKGPLPLGCERVETYLDLLMFFDELRAGEAQNKLDVAAIKSRWSQQKYRKKMAGKKQYNFLLSDKAIAELDKLVQEHGLSRPQVIEALIQFETKRRICLPEKMRAASRD